VPVTFKDVFVQFSRDEWALLDDEQKELHRSVMQSNYEMLMSLYCDLAKPEVLLQMERGEPCLPAEPDLQGAAVSLKPAAEPDDPGCVSSEALLQVEAEQPPEGRCGTLKDSRSPSDAPDSSALHVLQEAVGAPADLRHSAASPPCPISTCCQEVLTLSLPPSPPPAAAGAEVGIPGEVLQEGIGAEEGLQEEDLKDAGSSSRDLEADAPEELGREEMPDLCQTAAHVDPSGSADLLGKPAESAGRTAACQRNSSREKFYSCVVCGKNFLLKINLIIHQRSHSNWVPYVCIECEQAFVSKKKIRHHLRIRAATGFCPPSDTEGCSSLAPCAATRGSGEQWEKPNPNPFPLSPQKITYTCTECMENFSSQNFLVLHQRTHADQHHFTLCLCCNRSFAWASEFVRHRQSGAGRKAFWCTECQKACKRHHRPRGHQKLPLGIAPV
ncbi:Z324B protein, partial [Odontophorus gujanensis]|nr:Z324B protein [Odontophorus gujanensis]